MRFKAAALLLKTFLRACVGSAILLACVAGMVYLARVELEPREIGPWLQGWMALFAIGVAGLWILGPPRR